MEGVRKVVLYRCASAPWVSRIGGGVVFVKGGGRGGGVCVSVAIVDAILDGGIRYDIKAE